MLLRDIPTTNTSPNAGEDLSNPHQYAVRVDDGVEAMGNGEYCALPKLLPNRLLNQLIGPEGEGRRVNQPATCKHLQRDFYCLEWNSV